MNLSFAATCFSVSLYDVSCALLYSTTNFIDGLQAQKGNFIGIAAMGVCFCWFIADFLKIKPNKAIYIFTLYCLSMIPITGLHSSYLTLTLEKPNLRHVRIGNTFEAVFYEVEVGPLLVLLTMVIVVFFFYQVTLLFRYYTSKHEAGIILIILAMTFLYITVVNDTLVAFGVYSFIYLFEYSFMGLVLAMSYALLMRFLNLYEEIADLNINLEQNVVERTEKLQNTNVALSNAETKVRSLLESSPDFIINIDKNHTIQYINRPHEGQLFGYEIGKSIFESLDNQYHDVLKNAIKRSFEASINDIIETKKIFLDGKVYWNEFRLSPIVRNQSINGIMLISTDITKRKLAEIELESTQKELLEKAHKAGMADTITDILHNVGNLLNSVVTSAQKMRTMTKESKIRELQMANRLLEKNMDNIESFISHNPKGKKLMQYYLVVEREMNKQHSSFQYHLERLNKKVDTIANVIMAQQSLASLGSYEEELDLNEFLAEILDLESSLFEASKIKIVKELHSIPVLKVQKTKLVEILINLIQNANDAMHETPLEDRTLTISTNESNQSVFVKISDTGHGIAKDNLSKIFSHGFSTKRKGHGFGLHSCANYMTEMGGKMWAESEGNGASFILQFPLSK